MKTKRQKARKPANTAPPRKMGAPSTYTQEKAERICEQVALCRPLDAISKDKDMPSRQTIYTWLDKHPDFLDMYMRARDQQADALASQILEIADEAKKDDSNEAIQRARLRIDARKWLAAKMAPRKYSDKLVQEHTGADGAPLKVETEVRFVMPPNNVRRIN